MSGIVEEFNNHIMKNGGIYTHWYCGIARDPKQRLFNDHNVNQQSQGWIHTTQPIPHEQAREIENYFLERGCQGGPGGGDHNTRFVYAYKITRVTRQ